MGSKLGITNQEKSWNPNSTLSIVSLCSAVLRRHTDSQDLVEKVIIILIMVNEGKKVAIYSPNLRPKDHSVADAEKQRQ